MPSTKWSFHLLRNVSRHARNTQYIFLIFSSVPGLQRLLTSRHPCADPREHGGDGYTDPEPLTAFHTIFLHFVVRGKTNVPLGICVRKPGLVRNTLFEVFLTLRPHEVTVHRQQDDSIFGFFRFDSVLCHLSSNLVEQIQCCVPIQFVPSTSV